MMFDFNAILAKRLYVKRIRLDNYGKVKDIEFHAESSLTAKEIKDFIYAYEHYFVVPPMPEKPTRLSDLMSAEAKAVAEKLLKDSE